MLFLIEMPDNIMGIKNLFEIATTCIGRKGIVLCTQRVIALIATGLLLACNLNVKNEHDGDGASAQASAVPHIDSALVSRAYPMTNVSAGPFRIGAVIEDTMAGFEVEKSIEIKTVSEETTIEIPIYTYYIGNEGWVRITPQYDALTGRVSNNIGEIYVFSDLFLTDKCIGAISSLEDLARVYPDINIRYIGEDAMFAFATSQLPNVSFLLERENYIGTEHDADLSSRSKLDLSDFNEKSHFYAIRLSQQ